MDATGPKISSRPIRIFCETSSKTVGPTKNPCSRPATSIFTSSGRAAREYARHATASMVGVNIGVAAPMSYFPFGGARDSFFGDLKVHGRDAFDFYTDKKVTITRWL